MEKIYVVTECGKDGNDMFATQLGVYSTLEKAQKRMIDCYNHTYSSLPKGSKIVSYEVNPMETTILFNKGKHMVFIEERNLDENSEEFYFQVPTMAQLLQMKKNK